MLKQNTSQQQTQRSLPKIILQQSMLAIPALALDNIIKRELELNPMLEEGNEYEQEDSENTDEPGAADLISEKNKINEDDVNYESEKEKVSEDEYNWDEYFDNEETEIRNTGERQEDNYETVISTGEKRSVNESLMLQLHLSGLSAKDIFTGEEIIGSLNEDGYFTENKDEIIADLNSKKAGTEFEDEEFTLDDLNSTIKYFREKFDPPGIAAADLKDCLIIQAERSDADESLRKLSLEVIMNHFDDLRLKRYEKISKELGIELSEVKEIFTFIQKLNPRPGEDEGSDEKDYIIPDLILKKDEDEYEIILNDKYTPSLRISKSYREIYRNQKSSLDKTSKEFILNNFNKAKWFIDAINSRRETLIKIMAAILVKQKSFFDNDESGLKPMYEKDVAEEINMDASTISRAVRGKYVQTPYGIYELRSFFTTPLATNDGEEVSNTEVKILLKAIIDKEDKSNPLSDEELSVELKKKGLKIARRTVAKYREAINIPVSKQRREIL